jgi:hypothetical protein
MLERVAPTLPQSVEAITRARLLDLDGRTVSLIMEWECACFYLRRGYTLAWTEPNAVGPEFRASDGAGLTVDVECARFKRNWLEVFSDEDACNAALGVWNAVAKPHDCRAVGAGPRAGTDDRETT